LGRWRSVGDVLLVSERWSKVLPLHTLLHQQQELTNVSQRVLVALHLHHTHWRMLPLLQEPCHKEAILHPHYLTEQTESGLES
jgi:hypothetical protein